jgi:rRNA maturation protein Nop10
MSQKSCSRCNKNVTYMYTYSEFCKECRARAYMSVPDHIPDEQVSKWLISRRKNV